MTIFTFIRYKNFLSTGDYFNEISLNKNTSTLISGKNGAGKSTVLDAITFGLFGKPHRNVKKNQLLNSINGKNMLVEIGFRIGSKEYLVRRGIKPNIFEIHCNGKLMNQESHNRDYQKVLEKNILKMDFRAFNQVVILGSGNYVPFMQLKTSDRRQVIEELLDINIFSKMNVLLRERNSKLKAEIKDTTYKIELIKENISLTERHIKDIKAIDRKNSINNKKKIAELRDEIELLQSRNEKLQEEVSDSRPDIEAKLKKLNAINKKLSTYYHKIESNLNNNKKHKSFFCENDACPTCSQEITEETKRSKIQSYESKISEYESALGELSLKSDENEKLLREVKKMEDEVFSKVQDVNTNIKLINNIEKQLIDLQKDNPIPTDLEVKEKQLDDKREQLIESQNLSLEQRNTERYLSAISEMLKDSGIKTKIIKEYLPIMNRLINQYLQVLDFFVKFDLDESFEETIRSRHRDNFSYNSFSEGQKARIDLSLLFAWRKIAAMKNSVNCNLLFMDEVFSGSLDFDGTDNLFKILRTLKSGTNTFIISHDSNVLESKFDEHISFELVKNFSRMKKI